MKKFLLRLAALALPFVLYFGLFVAFDPADYFGVNGASTAGNSVVTRVKRFVENPQDAIILGDSRMAHFDMDLVAQVTGRAWSNLAFGGASMNESVDLFWLAVQQNPGIDTVVFEASFYTLRQGDTRNRTDAILTAVNNPVAYLFNFNYNVDMLQNVLENVRHWLDPSYVIGEATDTGHWTEADYVDETGARLPFRRNLIDYAHTILDVCQGYAVNEENLAAVLEIAAYCREHGIRLVFVMPPVDGAIREYVFEGLDLWDELAAIKEALEATGAAVLDYEYQPRHTFGEEQFYDGFHLDIVTGLPEYTEILFEEVMG